MYRRQAGEGSTINTHQTSSFQKNKNEKKKKYKEEKGQPMQNLWMNSSETQKLKKKN